MNTTPSEHQALANGLAVARGPSAETLLRSAVDGGLFAHIDRCGDGWLAWTTTHSQVAAVKSSEGRTVALRGWLQGPWPSDLTSSPGLEPTNAASAAAALIGRGRHMVDGLVGRFVIVGAERFDAAPWIATDHQGAGEVFHTTRPDGTHVASTSLWALVEVCGDLELNRAHEDMLLRFGFIPSPHTVISQVERQRPGMVTTLDGSTPVGFEPTKPDVRPAPKTLDEAIEGLEHHLLEGIRSLVPNGAPVGVLLGGFDSALVAAAAARLGHQVDTYSFRYREERYNQAFAEEVADLCGGRHHWIDMTPERLAKVFPRFGQWFNAPTNWPIYVLQTVLVAEAMTADGIERTISGDGCDNLFWGYPLTYRRGQVVDLTAKLPSPVLKAMKAGLSLDVWRHLGRPATVARGVVSNALRPTAEARGYVSFRVMDESDIERLRPERPAGSIDPEALATDLAEAMKGKSVNELSYLGKKLLTPSAIKLTSSADWMGQPIASPYQTPAMVAYAASLDAKFLRPPEGEGGIGKYALVKMAETKKYLPSEIIHQPKMAAADVPLHEWYSGPLRPTIEDLLDGLPFAADPNARAALFEETVGDRLYSRLIGRETNSIANLHHDLSLLATYGAFGRVVA